MYGDDVFCNAVLKPFEEENFNTSLLEENTKITEEIIYENKKINLFKEFFDIITIDFKVGIGINLQCIAKLGIDLGSMQGSFSTADGYKESFTVGVNGAIVGVSNSCDLNTERAKIYELHDNGNLTGNIGPVLFSEEDGVDVDVNFGFQLIVGASIHFSGKELLDYIEKTEKRKYENRHK